jgi:hypothetical protein
MIGHPTAASEAASLHKTSRRRDAQRGPSKPWLKQVLATLEQWAAEQKYVRFVLRMPDCSIAREGRIAHIGGMLSFYESNTRVTLIPEEWNSVRFDKEGAIRVGSKAGKTGFTITEVGVGRRGSPENMSRVCAQFETWMKLGLELTVFVSYGAYVKIESCILKSLSTPTMFALKGKSGEHLLVLEKCRLLMLERHSEFCMVTLHGEPQEPAVQISDKYQAPEDAVLRFGPGSAMVH